MSEKRYELIPMSDHKTGEIWEGLFDNKKLKYVTKKLWGGSKKICDELNTLNEDLIHELKVSKTLRDVVRELRKENKRLTDKLNNTALELVDDSISQGKAVEISEMNYQEFLDFRARNGKPMELQL